MPNKPRILIVEDEPAISRGLVFNFEAEGYEATAVEDGPAALKHFEPAAEPPDLVILDLMLPGMSGYDICEAIRRTHPEVPVLVLSARTLTEDKVRAFETGGDQYMTKPFALPELLARVKRLLASRPKAHATPPVKDRVVLGDVTADFAAFEIRRGDDVERLTTMETALLRYFVEHPGRVLSRADLMRDVWSQSAEVSSRSVDNFVMRLRKLIETDPSQPKHLISVRGTGYRFDP